MAREMLTVLHHRGNWQEVMFTDTKGITSNFYLHFAPGIIGDKYRKRPVFQRIRKQNPDLVLRCLVSGVIYSKGKKSKEEHYQTIFPAYKFMEQNVHLDDPGVKDKTGKVDRQYLFR